MHLKVNENISKFLWSISERNWAHICINERDWERLCLFLRLTPLPLDWPCWFCLWPWGMWHVPFSWAVSNKLFLMAIFSLSVALTIPEYKIGILKQVLVLRIPHLPGLWHLTLVSYRINQSDNLLFQFSWTYLCLWKTPFTFTVYLQEVRKRDD